MKAIIRLDVPEWQIGQEVKVYFPDTMCATGICEDEERPKGKWEFMNEMYGVRLYKCTNCGTPQDLDENQHIELFHYCTNCGADMRGEE